MPIGRMPVADALFKLVILVGDRLDDEHFACRAASAATAAHEQTERAYDRIAEEDVSDGDVPIPCIGASLVLKAIYARSLP